MNEHEEATSPETVEETTLNNQGVETPQAPEARTSKELETALAQKAHFREKAEKAEAERKALETKLNEVTNARQTALDVEDYIDISASLEGLDQREKERLAREHKLTGRPLSEIRNDEDFKLWQEAYRQKVEKERQTLAPSSTQSESDRPKSFMERLNSASTLAEKEELLRNAGLTKEVRRKADRVNIGNVQR